MTPDPILQEIWDARQQLWKGCNQDIHQLLAFYQQRQEMHPERMMYMEELEEVGTTS
jgi:hypothetical protein